MGESEWDGELPTPRHVAENLHALLEEVGAEPPYVLVGHSLGGPFIRMFTAVYPEDVGGLVYVDPTAIATEEDARALAVARGWDYQRWREWLEATGSSEEDAQREIEETYRQNMADTTLSPQTKVILELGYTDYAEFHSLPPIPDIPVSVLIGGRFNASLFPPQADFPFQLTCQGRECHPGFLEVETEILSRLAQESTNGTVTMTPNSGHFIQIDEPELVVQAIREVVEASVR